MTPGFRQPEHLADLPMVFLVKNHSCSELNLWCAFDSFQNTLALTEENVFWCSGISEGIFSTSSWNTLSTNSTCFCVSNKYSSDTSWCDMSFYLPFAERNNHNVLFLLFIRCNLYSDFVSVIGFFPNLVLMIILEPELPLELVSAIFINFLFFRQMIALHKLWKMLFISSKKLFSFSSYSNFCISILPSFSTCRPLL